MKQNKLKKKQVRESESGIVSGRKNNTHTHRESEIITNRGNKASEQTELDAKENAIKKMLSVM